MDGSLRQPFTFLQGKPEVVTVLDGLLRFREAGRHHGHGRRGGWTYVESFKTALKYDPRFLQLHQFQEFTGAPEGSQPFYGDSYSVELSDDIEPVSLTTPAYRGDGGWGFHFLNLTRALVDLYRQKVPETTVLAIAQAGSKGRWSPADMLTVRMDVARQDRREASVMALNGKPVARALTGTEATIDLSGCRRGRRPASLRRRRPGGLPALIYSRGPAADPTGAGIHRDRVHCPAEVRLIDRPMPGWSRSAARSATRTSSSSPTTFSRATWLACRQQSPRLSRFLYNASSSTHRSIEHAIPPAAGSITPEHAPRVMADDPVTNRLG